MILIRIALRNLLLHKFKALIVGSILFIGTILIVVGSSILDEIDRTMEISLVNAITGHLQVYSASAKEDLQIFGNLDGSMADVGLMHNFPKVHRALSRIENVKAVVPMGVDTAVTTTSNNLERKLAELREAVQKNDAKRVEVLVRHIRNMIEVLSKDLRNVDKLIDTERAKVQIGDYNAVLAKARSDELWNAFATDPLNTLEFLENEVGPLGLSEDMIWLRYLGADMQAFQKTFDRFEIVDGQAIPPGKRGFLFDKWFYEEEIKNKTARRLDKLKEKIELGNPIASCDDCKTWIRLNVSQAASIVYQLDDNAVKIIAPSLKTFLKRNDDDLVVLMKALLDVNDQNFAAHYAFFYQTVAPHIILYTVAVGDEFVLTAFARGSGYVRKVPLKVYGTYQFRGLDKSPIANGTNLMDLMTFRDLYGYLTSERKGEQDAIRKAVGVQDIKPENAEALFETEAPLTGEGEIASFALTENVDLKAAGEKITEELYQRTYTQDEIDSGIVINAAVMLRDGSKLKETMAEIKAVSEREQLDIKVDDWRKSSGIVGQLIDVIRMVLYAAVLIIFIVALIIINNSLLMSTMERTREIGTLRAIGAQRGFILRMFLFETGVLTALFGALGAITAVGIMMILNRVGIPAWTDFFHFLFSGPRLYPTLTPKHIVFAITIIAVVGLIATYYPARIATRITPREAMASEE